MNIIDWLVLGSALVFFVSYGVYRGRRNRDLEDYLLADRSKRWYTVAFSIMATQASAITFLSTPGQAYVDGMRFIQFYFGLPLAMVVLSVTVVPIYHRLRVFTAYQYLEGRFDLKTRGFTAFLFLIQRGLAAGLTIYAPAVIVSVLLGLKLSFTILVIGVLVVIYTTSGGTKAVDHTNFLQMCIILFGMTAAFFVLISLLPDDISFRDAVWVAGQSGRLNAIDLSFDPANRYNIWSGLIGGFFLALSYFGTDQSQVGRYLGGSSITQSRLGLLFNGLVKVPMQFFILFIGAMVFVFYQFIPPPVHFNSVATGVLASGPHAAEYQQLRETHEKVSYSTAESFRDLLDHVRMEDPAAVEATRAEIRQKRQELSSVRARVIDLIRMTDPRAETNDTNYIFLTFVLNYLPVGLVGLVMAAIFAASMSSTASELNALASTTIVDFVRRMWRPAAGDLELVAWSRLATMFWGAVAISFALFANQLGSLVEAVNRLGSLFYGTILGIFLLAFYFKRVGGTAAFLAALIGEAAVIIVWQTTEIAYLWYNLIGSAVVIAAALALSTIFPKGGNPAPSSSNQEASA